MQKYKKHNPKITFVMADGTVKHSTEGITVPRNEHTEIAYRILEKYGHTQEFVN